MIITKFTSAGSVEVFHCSTFLWPFGITRIFPHAIMMCELVSQDFIWCAFQWFAFLQFLTRMSIFCVFTSQLDFLFVKCLFKDFWPCLCDCYVFLICFEDIFIYSVCLIFVVVMFIANSFSTFAAWLFTLLMMPVSEERLLILAWSAL